ncbi:MAG: glycerol-3-phosphate dehydrogenase/oxidase, partial [Propionibacteriaceae bacterium]|nr:glycerol-3-phosphate dehydrogenase/oxidase [Propionibacteriaceae bacterium]
ETYQFRLVREGVKERELSLKLAPHLTAVKPHLYAVYEGDSYGLAMLNFALTFYDAFSGQWRQRRHRLLSRSQTLALEPHLNPRGLKGAGLYYDVLTDDARFTLAIVASAAEHGAEVLNHTAVTGLVREGEKVVGVETRDQVTGRPARFHGAVVVNATGPWTGRLASEEYGVPAAKLLPSKGAHLVFAKRDFPLEHVVFLRSPVDGRVTWPAPALEPDRVYVGTTDTPYDGDPDRVEPDERDVRYLLNVANHTIPDAHLDESHIIGSWAGLRPLVAPAPGTAVGRASREHRVETGPGGMVTISGGKLTSCRVMGKHVVDEALRQLGRRAGPSRAAAVPLAGGLPDDIAQAAEALAASDVPPDLQRSWLRRFGGKALRLLELWRSDAAQRETVGPRGLTGAEITHAVVEERAATLEDLMVRRTSLFFWEPDGALAAVDAIADRLDGLLGWTPEERARQIAAYAALVARHRPRPAGPASADKTTTEPA